MRKKTAATRAYKQAWKKANREKMNAVARRTYAKDPAAMVAKQVAWQRANPEKVKRYQKTWAGRNPEKVKAAGARQRVRRYGMTLDGFEAMRITQCGLCAICSRVFTSSKTTHIDHCHVTGKTRGLLCSGCNVGIGNLRDDPKLLRLAADYLESTGV